MLTASKLKKFDFDDLLMDLPLGKKLKRWPKKMPHCLAKPKFNDKGPEKDLVEGDNQARKRKAQSTSSTTSSKEQEYS